MKTKNDPGGRTFIERARRAQILTATAEVVAHEGFARASLARIARQAGVSKGVVTYHFSSKDEILEQMVTDYFERGWEFIEPHIEAEPTALGQLNARIDSQLEFFTTNPTEFFAMVSIMSNHRNDDGTSRYDDDKQEDITAMAEILEAGQQDGEFRDFNTTSVANIILRGIDGVLGSWADDTGKDISDEIDALKDFIDHAIRKTR